MTNQPYQDHSQTLAGGSTEASKARKASLILGIISVVILGIVLGPLAIVKAHKAERLGERATAGKVLGYIGTIGGIISIIYGIVQFV